METLRVGNLAERVTVLQMDSAGRVTPVTVYKKKKKKRKNRNDWMKRPGSTAMDQMRTMGNSFFNALNDRGRKPFAKGMFPMM